MGRRWGATVAVVKSNVVPAGLSEQESSGSPLALIGKAAVQSIRNIGYPHLAQFGCNALPQPIQRRFDLCQVVPRERRDVHRALR